MIIRNLLVVAFILFAPLLARSQAKPTLSISAEDKAAIVNFILIDLRSQDEKKFEPYRFIIQEHIQPKWVSRTSGHYFTFLRWQDRDEKARKLGGLLHYIHVSKFELKQTGVEIWVGVRQYSPSNRDLVPPLVKGPSIQYFLKKIDGKWQGRTYMSIC